MFVVYLYYIKTGVVMDGTTFQMLYKKNITVKSSLQQEIQYNHILM